jgi:hypothetical protein
MRKASVKKQTTRRRNTPSLSELTPQKIDPNSAQPVYLTVPETAALWRVKPATVRHKLSKKQIRGYKIFGRTVIALSDAQAKIQPIETADAGS